MKKSILWTAIYMFFSLGLIQAQMLDRGNFIVGSTLGFSTSASEVRLNSAQGEKEGQGPSSLQINFAPDLGYFIQDNFALGLAMDFTFSSLEEPNSDRTDNSNLLFGPFARYYFPMEDQTAFFIEGNFGFGNSSDDQLIGESKQSVNTNIFATGFGPGFTIISKKGIGIEAIFKYNYARSKFNTEISEVKQETITKTNQFDISIGIQYYFQGVRPVVINR